MRILNLARLFWVTEVALLALVIYGLRAGWTTQRQWSDGLFFAGFFQLVVGGISLMVPPGEAFDAAKARYIDRSSIENTRFELIMETARKRQFGMIAFFGGLLTLIAAAVVAWV